MLGDEARTGGLVTATAGDQVDQVRSLVAEEQRITYDVLQTTLGISSWAVTKILHEELGLHKLSSRWIPHLLTKDPKKARVDWCKLMLVKFDMGKPIRFLR